MTTPRRFNICGNCVYWWCTDRQEMTGFCRCDLRGKYYEDHADCKNYKDKFERDNHK